MKICFRSPSPEIQLIPGTTAMEAAERVQTQIHRKGPTRSTTSTMNGTWTTALIPGRLARHELQERQDIRHGNQGANRLVIDARHFSRISRSRPTNRAAMRTEKRNPYFSPSRQLPCLHGGPVSAILPDSLQQQETIRVFPRRLTPERPRDWPCIQASLTTYARVNGGAP